MSLFSTVFNSNNAQFNPAADLDGDGRVGESDLLLLGPRYTAVNASAATKQAYNNLLINPATGVTRTVTALLDNSAGLSLSKTSAGTLNINGPQSNGLGASLSVSNGTVNFNTDVGSSAPNLQLNVSASAAVNLPAVQHLKNLNVTGGTVSSNSLIDTAGLLISGNSVVDLATGDMIVRNGDLASISDLVRRARANGAWSGTGLTSSAAAGDIQHVTTLGILLNDDGTGHPIYTSFAGQNVDAGSILIRYTLTGDLNLDQVINSDDYAMMDRGYATHASSYQMGDINLDGTINADDFFLMDRAFSNQSAILTSLQISPIPEPSFIFLAAVALVLTARAPRP